MRWEDERYIRYYTRNTPEWSVLPWTARGLFGLIMREVDRAGILELGKLGPRAVAVAVRAPWNEIEGPLKDLVDDGCIVIHSELRALLIPNFIAAQEAAQSDKARKKASRERARDIAHAKSLGISPESQTVTPAGDPDGQDGREDSGDPGGDTTQESQFVPNESGSGTLPSRIVSETSHAVTRGHSVLSRAVLSRAVPDARATETGYDLACRVWCELWRERHGAEFVVGWPAGLGGDDRVLQRLGGLAIGRGNAAEAVLRHKVASYLADPGNADWLVNQRHPLRFLERDWNKYGEPSGRQKPLARVEPKPADMELTGAEIADRKLKYEAREKERAEVRERNAKIQTDLDHDLAAIRQGGT